MVNDRLLRRPRVDFHFAHARIPAIECFGGCVAHVDDFDFERRRFAGVAIVVVGAWIIPSAAPPRAESVRSRGVSRRAVAKRAWCGA